MASTSHGARDQLAGRPERTPPTTGSPSGHCTLYTDDARTRSHRLRNTPGCTPSTSQPRQSASSSRAGNARARLGCGRIRTHASRRARLGAVRAGAPRAASAASQVCRIRAASGPHRPNPKRGELPAALGLGIARCKPNEPFLSPAKTRTCRAPVRPLTLTWRHRIHGIVTWSCTHLLSTLWRLPLHAGRERPAMRGDARQRAALLPNELGGTNIIHRGSR
jgi:hypothetical protein